MEIDSILLKLERKGDKKSPYYSIEVYGNGKVIFTGYKNVRIIGEVQDRLDDDAIIDLLSGLKEIDFFSIENKYNINTSLDRSYTTISISLPVKEGVEKSKIISHYDDDFDIPRKIIEYEKKIEKVVNSYRWIKKGKIKSEGIKRKKSIISFSKKPNKKIIYGLFIAIIIIFIVSAFLFQQVLMNNNQNNNSIVYDKPAIIDIATDSNIYEIGDMINIEYNYNKVTHNNYTNVKENVYLYQSSNLVKKYDRILSNISHDDMHYNFIDFYINDSWPVGYYTLIFEITDKTSGLKNEKKSYFNIYEDIPKIDKLITASEIYIDRTYDLKTVFDVNDTIFIFSEYGGIDSTNNNCNIIIKSKVYRHNNTYVNVSIQINKVENNTFFYYFDTNNSWDTGVAYYYDIYLYDNSTGLSTKDENYFYLI